MKNKYIITGSEEALEYFQNNNHYNVICVCRVLSDIFFVETELDIDEIKKVNGVYEVELDYIGKLC